MSIALSGWVALISCFNIHNTFSPLAAITAAKVNQLTGFYAHLTPATQVAEIIKYIPEALRSFREEDKCKTSNDLD